MPSNKPIFTLRADKELIQKMQKIAEANERSTNQEIIYQLKKVIREYELDHGKIEI